MARGRFVILSIILDAVLVNAGIVAAYFIRFSGHLPAFNFAPYVALSPLLTVLYLGAGYIFGLYEPERTEGTWELARAVFQAVTLGTVLTVAVAFFAGPRFFSFSRLVIVIAWAAQFLLLVGWRATVLRFTSVLWPEQRILIVGTGDLAIELASELEKRSSWGYRVVGHLRHGESGAAVTGDLPILGDARDVTEVVAREQIDRVIIASPVALRELIQDMALSHESDVRVEVIPELYEIFIGTVDSTVSDIPLMELTRRAAPGWYLSSKRLLDVLGSLVVLIALSPLLLITFLAILFTMGWPVLFRQERVGKGGRTFSVIKFRSMVKNAEALSGPVLADADDPRVTALGRFLRKSRIDELPQLVNILVGDMSWVGPRPERPYFVEQFVKEIPGYRERFKVKPGVTGLAQVSGGYATTPERKLKFDLIYMYHQNLLMDIQILVETVRVVLTGRGAR